MARSSPFDMQMSPIVLAHLVPWWEDGLQRRKHYTINKCYLSFFFFFNFHKSFDSPPIIFTFFIIIIIVNQNNFEKLMHQILKSFQNLDLVEIFQKL